MRDRKLLEHVEQFQRPDAPIRVSRLIGVNAFDADSDGRDQSSERPSS